MKQFCKNTSGFEGGIFLLLVLAVASFHSSALLGPLLSVCASEGVFDHTAAGCAWNKKTNSSFASLMLRSLLMVSCSSAIFMDGAGSLDGVAAFAFYQVPIVLP